MINEAEKFKDDDCKLKEKLEAKNNYENYIYHMKTTMEDDTLKAKLGDKHTEIMNKLDRAQEVLEVEQVSKEEYEKAQQELEQYINPIMDEIMKQHNGESIPQSVPEKNEEEPSIEEID